MMRQQDRRETQHRRAWQELLERSWHPLDWFVGASDREEALEPAEGTLMWVYRRIVPGGKVPIGTVGFGAQAGFLYQVGYYTPNGKWTSEPLGDSPESHGYKTAEEAAARVSYLNGGSPREKMEPIGCAYITDAARR